MATNSGCEVSANIKWDEIGFSTVPTDCMYMMKCLKGGSFSEGSLVPYGKIELNPSASVLNYGQGIFEGLKAYRREDGHIVLFRPDQNAQRMKMGAERMSMPSPSCEQFVDAVKETVLANKRWVPPPGKGALYIRPLLLGTGSVLSVEPAPEYTFLVYVTPVGNYFKDKTLLHLLVEENVHRAAPGGTGGIKAITNYSPTCQAVFQAKAKGFSDVLFLDAVNSKNVEEVSSCNIFIVKGNVISTPPTNGTILPGITRKSVIEIALGFGYQVEERDIPVEELATVDEAFCTGTAVVIKPVGSITYRDKRFEYNSGADTVSQKLYSALTGIQMGDMEDKRKWTLMID